MRTKKIIRQNGQVYLIVDDEGAPPEYTYAKEMLDIQSRSYWSEVELTDKASAVTVLAMLREVSFGDATLEDLP